MCLDCLAHTEFRNQLDKLIDILQDGTEPCRDSQPQSIPLAEIPAIFRQMRRSRGLTQKEVADAVGISISYVSLFEAGRRGLKLHQIIDIFGVLEKKISIIVEDLDESPIT